MSDYDYYYEAYIGLQLEDSFETADKCIIADLVGFIDNIHQFMSNYTWEYVYKPIEERNYMLPVLNVTKMVGINFASLFPDCYKFVFLAHEAQATVFLSTRSGNYRYYW